MTYFHSLIAFAVLVTSIMAIGQDAIVSIENPRTIGSYDLNAKSPLSLASILTRIHSDAGVPAAELRASNDSLYALEASYRVFADTTARDMDNLIKDMGIDVEKNILRTYKPEFALTSEGRELRKNGNVTRVFDAAWLKSMKGYFTLTGIVNRIDRKDFIGGCGEVRFTYRLAYKFKKEKIYSSRMPFTLNVIFAYPDDGQNCKSIVKLWSDVTDLPNKIFNLGKATFLQLETNFQAARFPSDLERVKARGFAGQAIYLMRIFEMKQGKFSVKKLENTPDVNAIIKNNRLEDVKAWVKKNIQAIDLGVYEFPKELSTDLVLSYSTLGSMRNANKPFNHLLDSKDFNSIITELESQGVKLQHINSGEALRDRLNSMTCMGCHQTASVAGFHFLGKDRMELDGDDIAHPTDGNRLEQGTSPHFYADFPRRKAYMRALLTGAKPNQFRPHPSAPAAQWENGVTYVKVNDGQACPLDNHFKNKWGCEDPASTCQSVVQRKGATKLFGLCTPPQGTLYSGLACLGGTLESGAVSESSLGFNASSFLDKLTSETSLYPREKSLSCRPSNIGVPLGRLYRKCISSTEVSLSKLPGKEICAIVGGSGFEEMAKGQYDSDKYADGVSRGMLDACGPNRYCREDYICQELPDFLGKARFGVKKENIAAIKNQKIGFCTPTYFVFQMRLDGHPTP